MIISRTPLRISFVGGGSDLKLVYQQGYGAVVSSAINKYVYVMVNKRFEGDIRVAYSKSEFASDVDQIEHDIVRESLKFLGIDGGLDISYVGDFSLGRTGTGLGASSALTVGILNALHCFKGESVLTERLAQEACHIEIDILGRPIGKQDQYACAYGGFNYIRFNPDETVVVEPIQLNDNNKFILNSRLLLLNTGLAPESSIVLTEQRDKIKDNQDVYYGLFQLCEDFKMQISKGDISIFGDFLHKNWLYKKRFASRITNHNIDNYYNIALEAGATGGKILGSGGGGFLLLYCEGEGDKNKVRKALNGLKEVPFTFEIQGSRIIHSD